MMRKLIQTQCPALTVLLVLIAGGLLFSCKDHSYSSPPGYDLRQPIARQLGKSLNEISGLTYNSADTSLLAISDSKRKIFQIDLHREKLKDYAEKMYTQSDFEDLVKMGDSIYVLISNGTLLQMPLKVKDSTQTLVHSFWQSEGNDFESLYYDPESNGLIMLCKTCEADKGKRQRTAYRFDLATKQFDTTAFYTISTENVKSMVKNDDAEFKPSAAAIHPIKKQLYILSSAGQLLVIADLHGNIADVYNLNPDLYPQAEGIAFAPDGTLFISNEGKYGTPTLLTFPYRIKKAADKQNK